MRKHKEVAPLAGAWIEISWEIDNGRIGFVAPLAGAWIEIGSSPSSRSSSGCRSPRGSVD